MRILLIQPPLNPNIIGAGISYLTEPLALEILAASLPAHDVRILDMRIDNSLEKELTGFNPDIVGVTGYTTDVYNMLKITKMVKEYNSKILTVVGGHHATMVPGDFNRDFIDVAVMGDGEAVFMELVESYENSGDFSRIPGIAVRKNSGMSYINPRTINANLDKMPFPNRKLTENYRDKYFRGSWRPVASVMTSKGCPFRCNFCALWKIMDGKYLARSPESVVDELSQIKEKYIDFAEDNFLHDVKRADRIYRMIKEKGIRKVYKLYARSDTIVRHPDIIEKWKEIGAELVLVGLESFRDEELKDLNKSNSVKNNEEAVRILQGNGIEIAAYFIVNPDYTENDFNELAEYVLKMKLTQPIFTVLTPLPGTELYHEKYNELTTHNYELFDFVHSVLPTKLPLDKFYNCLLNLYKKCYSNGKDSSIVSSNTMFRQLYDVLSVADRPEIYSPPINSTVV